MSETCDQDGVVLVRDSDVPEGLRLRIEQMIALLSDLNTSTMSRQERKVLDTLIECREFYHAP